MAEVGRLASGLTMLALKALALQRLNDRAIGANEHQSMHKNQSVYLMVAEPHEHRKLKLKNSQ